MTERLHFHFSLSCIGEGNGNPLQCSCLENPRDRGAWWAAVYGVAQSRTRLKRLSSSRSSKHKGSNQSDKGSLNVVGLNHSRKPFLTFYIVVSCGTPIRSYISPNLVKHPLSKRYHLSILLRIGLIVYSCCSFPLSCLTFCNPMNCSAPGFTVLRYLPEFAQTHVH